MKISRFYLDIQFYCYTFASQPRIKTLVKGPERLCLIIMLRLFISHSWKYTSQFESVESFLEAEGVDFYDHSVPKDDPVHTSGSDEELEAAIDAKIRGCSCVIILAGVYATYSKWIQKELKIAINYNKPIIAVRPWGAERVSDPVTKAATVIVGWNAKSIANAVKQYSK